VQADDHALRLQQRAAEQQDVVCARRRAAASAGLSGRARPRARAPR